MSLLLAPSLTHSVVLPPPSLTVSRDDSFSLLPLFNCLSLPIFLSYSLSLLLAMSLTRSPPLTRLSLSLTLLRSHWLSLFSLLDVSLTHCLSHFLIYSCCLTLTLAASFSLRHSYVIPLTLTLVLSPPLTLSSLSHSRHLSQSLAVSFSPSHSFIPLHSFSTPPPVHSFSLSFILIPTRSHTRCLCLSHSLVLSLTRSLSL